jgi:glyoxylase I family protein
MNEGFVTGIGGIFFRSADSASLGKWYEKHFGITDVASGKAWIQEPGPTVFAAFKKDTAYFGRMEQQFMINFRVKDLTKFVQLLKEQGVRMDEKIMEESYGKFAWVYDPEGNKIELWEPQ